MSAFCTFCGAPVVRAGIRFCTACGRPLVGSDSSPGIAIASTVDPRHETGRRRAAVRGAYCDLRSGDLLSGFIHAGSGRAAAWLDRLVATRQLSVADQGGGVVAGGWGLGQLNRSVAVWFRPGTLFGEPTVLVGSTIAAIRPGHSEITRDGSNAQRSFADLVICPAEQNEAAAMISHFLIGMTGNPVPIGDPRPEEANFVQAPEDQLPRRVLLCEPAGALGSLVLFTHPGRGPESVPMPAGSWSVVLVYVIPAYEWYEAFDDTLSLAVDSTLRIHELLWDTSSGLDGRRDPAQAPVLDRYLEHCGLVGVLDLADQPWRLTAGQPRC